MDIKSLLGDAWKDGMTLDEINTALADRNLVDAASLPKQIAKDQFDKLASDHARLKKEHETLKNSSLSAEEQLKLRQEEAEAEKSQYKRKLSELRAKEIFVTNGLTELEYTPILSGIVSDNEESTLTLAKSMVDLIKAQREATEKTVRAELLKETPKPGAGTPPKGLTKEGFAKMSYNERAALFESDPELFKQLNE